ncbi:MAG: class I SAM-dependent methyltransferase [Sulfurimonas sp.]|jgi:ubiquinone/menaquinone biosynthesis C-methylase UbiE
MANLQSTYTNEHLQKTQSPHWYPTEWIIRTMAGSYPNLALDKRIYENAKVLDIGFGDGRNFTLLKNLGLKIYGVEITEEIVQSVQNKAKHNGIDCELKVGSNADIPYPNEYFDIILASSSMYYINTPNSFNDTVAEYMRVLKKGGVLIANFPEKKKNFICKNALELDDNVIEITNDIYNLRNGYLFKVFSSENELKTYSDAFLTNISTAYLYENYFGVAISMFILVGHKK